MTLPDHLAALRDEALQTTCASWAQRKGWKLSKGSIYRTGPCPMPGCGGTDRFNINAQLNLFKCRQCGISGEGVIKLVMITESISFTEACELITGRTADAPRDLEKEAEIRRRNEAAEADRQREAERYRQKARSDGYAIWNSASRDPARPVIAEYLMMRGLLTPTLMDLWEKIRLREHPDLPYAVALRTGGYQRVASGPAMLAAVVMPDGHFGAVHRTWLDLKQPKGKIAVPHPEKPGELVDPKKSLGIKQGGAIRLYTPDNPRRIIMGEGIETTLTPMVHDFEPDTAYWAGVDVGNMAGKAALSERGGQIQSEPDMAELECFIPPDWCEELIYLGETEAPGRNTVAKLTRGLKRAARLRDMARKDNPELPVLLTELVEPPADAGDINDLVMDE